MILWKNATIHTLKSPKDTHYQMATHQGLIVGFDEEINNLPFTQTVDLKGYHLYPGFVDAHLHLIGYGRYLEVVDLSQWQTKADVLKQVAASLEKGATYFEGYFDQKITKQDLNEISETKPLILKHNDYHSLTVNDFVLNTVGIKSESGFVTEADTETISQHFLTASDEVVSERLIKAVKKLYQYGITGGHSEDLSYYNGYNQTVKIFEKVNQKYPFRTQLLIHHHVLDDFLKAKHQAFSGHPFLEFGPIKIYYDGTFSSETALLHEPYQGKNHQGIRILAKQELETLIKKIRKHHLTVAVHVIGDLGLLEVAELFKKYPPQKGQKDRIIHASLACKKAIKMLKTLPVTFDIQPQFITTDLPRIHPLFSRPPRYLYPFKTYLKKGFILSGSSDAPIEDPNPLLGIYAAVYRESENQVHQKKERLSRYEAIKLYTSGANIPTYHTNRGHLEKGYVADFTVFEKNLLTVPKHEFLKNTVKMTVINEAIVFHDV